MRRNAMIIALAMLLSACGPAKEENGTYNGFIVLEEHEMFKDNLTQYILYDPETMVMYIYVKTYKTGGLSVIYNSDGTPKVYSPEE